MFAALPLSPAGLSFQGFPGAPGPSGNFNRVWAFCFPRKELAVVSKQTLHFPEFPASKREHWCSPQILPSSCALPVCATSITTHSSRSRSKPSLILFPLLFFLSSGKRCSIGSPFSIQNTEESPLFLLALSPFLAEASSSHHPHTSSSMIPRMRCFALEDKVPLCGLVWTGTHRVHLSLPSECWD